MLDNAIVVVPVFANSAGNFEPLVGDSYGDVRQFKYFRDFHNHSVGVLPDVVLRVLCLETSRYKELAKWPIATRSNSKEDYGEPCKGGD